MDNIMIHEKRLPKTKKRIAAEEISSAAIRSYSIYNLAEDLSPQLLIHSSSSTTSVTHCQNYRCSTPD